MRPFFPISIAENPGANTTHVAHRYISQEYQQIPLCLIHLWSLETRYKTVLCYSNALQKFVVQTFIILAPEVSSLQQTPRSTVNRALGARDLGGISSRSEIHSSFDTIHTFKTKTSFQEKQSVSFDSYCKFPSKKTYFENDGRYRASLETFHLPGCFSSKDDGDKRHWPYRRYRSPSENLASSKVESEDYFKYRKYRSSLKERTDFLSLSLSPPGSRNETLALREFPSLSPSKDVNLLELEDIHKIRYIENRESQEDESEYDAGGYMPINIGDVLRGQYKVCRKLGWGHFSTVWLCRNVFEDGPSYVALKICKSAHMFAAVAQDEIKLLRETKSIDPTHPGYKHIVQMVDTFKLLSVNGIHTAISMEIMGPSLLHILVQSDFRGIHTDGVKRIIQQVLKGLSYLHNTCKIIHTDVKPENILVRVGWNYIRSVTGKSERFAELGMEMPRSYVSSDCWVDRDKDMKDSDEDILAKFEEQRGQSYPYDKFLIELSNFRERHTEPRLTQPMWINPNIEIKIADLGNACWEDHHFSNEIQTRQYRALEVILGAGYSFPADIWSTGCMAFELATGEMLFSPKGDKDPSANLDHLCLIWETLGGIPPYITETGTNVRQYFQNGRLKNIPESSLRVWKIEDVLVDKYKWKKVDAIPFAGFLESLIEPDPVLRLTASTALQNEWLNSIE